MKLDQIKMILYHPKLNGFVSMASDCIFCNLTVQCTKDEQRIDKKMKTFRRKQVTFFAVASVELHIGVFFALASLTKRNWTHLQRYCFT